MYLSDLLVAGRIDDLRRSGASARFARAVELARTCCAAAGPSRIARVLAGARRALAVAR